MSKSRTVIRRRVGSTKISKAMRLKRLDDRSPIVIAGEALANHPGWEYFWEGYHDYKQRLKNEDAEELCLS